jgi:hypothetical protein
MDAIPNGMNPIPNGSDTIPNGSDAIPDGIYLIPEARYSTRFRDIKRLDVCIARLKNIKPGALEESYAHYSSGSRTERKGRRDLCSG